MLEGLGEADARKAMRAMEQVVNEAWDNENAGPFQLLPHRRTYRDYFRTIQEPMSLKKLRVGLF